MGRRASSTVPQPRASGPGSTDPLRILRLNPGPGTRRRSQNAERGRGFRRAEGLQVRLLQLGLAFVFLYASLSTLLDPLKFVAYVPSWMSMPGMAPMLRCFACCELLLSVALLTRRFTRPAALVAVLTLAGITVTNPGQFDVLFRNVAIICAALALALSDGTPRPSAGRAAPPRHRHRTSARARARARQQGDVDSCCSAVG